MVAMHSARDELLFEAPKEAADETSARAGADGRGATGGAADRGGRRRRELEGSEGVDRGTFSDLRARGAV
jgi:hypothetical protein